jgi:glucosylceramidase
MLRRKIRFLILALFSCFITMHKQLLKNDQNNEITVYTTAENTDFKLTQRPPVKFCFRWTAFRNADFYFVDPAKPFKLCGMGGAISDASAEVLRNYQNKTRVFASLLQYYKWNRLFISKDYNS